MDTMNKIIEVGVAIIRKGDQVLVGQRPSHNAFGGKWEFPGGKLEPAESPEECIIREIREELGISLKNLQPFLVEDHQYPNGKNFRLHFYFCEIAAGEPQALWHDEILWIEKGKLHTIDLLAADIGLVSVIQKKLV